MTGPANYEPWLHLSRYGISRFPLSDGVGTARGLVDASATVTDTYSLEAFGPVWSSTGSTPNPYRFGRPAGP